MFEIGDVIIYSEHGLCQIDDICEKTFSDVTKTYYVLHPLSAANLKISTPVDNDSVVMLKTLDKEQSEEVLQLFKEPEIDWNDDTKQRNKEFHGIIKSGDRKEIAKMLNSLMRKERELKSINKKMHDQDSKLLTQVKNILFKDIALPLNTSFDAIVKRVDKMIAESL
ncbi:CarD family transcriptional regulator [Rummeliibacillus sp. JY-2-4R]